MTGLVAWSLMSDLGGGALMYVGSVVAVASAACLPAAVSLYRDDDTPTALTLGLRDDTGGGE